MAVLKVGGISSFGAVGLWASGISFKATGGELGVGGFVASVALSILAFNGFTTVNNSGAEITEPHRNVGRAIVWSIAVCVVVYLLVAFAVRSSLPLDRSVAAKDYALAECDGRRRWSVRRQFDPEHPRLPRDTTPARSFAASSGDLVDRHRRWVTRRLSPITGWFHEYGSRSVGARA